MSYYPEQSVSNPGLNFVAFAAEGNVYLVGSCFRTANSHPAALCCRFSGCETSNLRLADLLNLPTLVAPPDSSVGFYADLFRFLRIQKQVKLYNTGYDSG